MGILAASKIMVGASGSSDIPSVADLTYVGTKSLTRDPEVIDFKPDGSYMYVQQGTRRAADFSLSTSWDIYNSTTITEGDQTGVIVGAPPTVLNFKADGLQSIQRDNRNWQRTTYSTAWDLTSDTTGADSAGTYDTVVSGTLSANGEDFIFYDQFVESLVQGHFTTAWDETTSSEGDNTLDLSSTGLDLVNTTYNFTRMSVRPDGMALILCVEDHPTYILRQIRMTSPWDLSTASYDSADSFNISSQVGGVNAIYYAPSDVGLVYVARNQDIYQYSF